MSYRVAVASKQGVAVDEHFGHAKHFSIYSVSEAGCSLIEKREVDHYCLGGQGDRSALEKILDTIDDCDAVLVARVGDGPADKLRRRGVEPVADYPWEAVEPALTAWFASVVEGAA
ncbi:NifB/NifX family molybdenum-iron cluster-binding protein [Marinobacterium sp. YM272]|uniref:NifB/NifX family molybdenum-iron cluster-binding protein n=1 Tax=Marinobacterium sp. YM272 TaxID=3421654 RepID=UPI003D7F20DE